MARTIIKNEQMKLDKRAECHDLLDDVHDMLEHAAGLVKELDKVIPYLEIPNRKPQIPSFKYSTSHPRECTQHTKNPWPSNPTHKKSNPAPQPKP